MKSNILKAIQEDARLGKAQLRTLSFPIKAKKKNGEHIHKLPETYKTIGEIKENMNKDYSEIIEEKFLKKLEGILK